jgi:sulfatase modifying factor 1
LVKPILAIVLLLALAVPASAITIETVPVGDVGNPNDPSDGDKSSEGVQNYGAVPYAYSIGKYEVTTGQYTAFLNAVAATDTYSLYNTNMATNLSVAGIDRNGASGSYTYSVIGSPNHPISYVNWGDAARFTNWLHNGQPTGPQNASTTEDGAYLLNGAVTDAPLRAIVRKAGAKWFIPSENEWYKAAYYQPASKGGDADGYWDFPVRLNSTRPYSDQPPGETPDNTHVENAYNNDGLSNGYNDGYAVTGSTIFSSSQNYLTDVGAYTSSSSYYGTFDQGGNVEEWNEFRLNQPYRGVRGGSWNGGTLYSLASDHEIAFPTSELADLGFRVATLTVPVPGDFDGNGTVEPADYLVWRHNNGSVADYNLWRAHYGQSISGSGASIESASVPEPSSLALLMVLGVILTLQTARRY